MLRLQLTPENQALFTGVTPDILSQVDIVSASDNETHSSISEAPVLGHAGGRGQVVIY
jgi:hypothetical protein